MKHSLRLASKKESTSLTLLNCTKQDKPKSHWASTSRAPKSQDKTSLSQPNYGQVKTTTSTLPAIPIVSIFAKASTRAYNDYNYSMWTLCSHIGSTRKHLYKKFVEGSMRLLRMERPFTGGPVTGILSRFMKLLVYVKDSTFISQFALRSSTTCCKGNKSKWSSENYFKRISSASWHGAH